MRIALSTLVAFATLFLATFVSAQNLPPDIVQLTNGGMVRGTIMENIPGDHVTIQLATGETHRFAAAEVRSAGPATAAAPVLAPPTADVPPAPGTLAPPQGYAPQPGYGQPPQLDPSLVTLRVASATPGVTLHRLTGTANIAMWTGRGMGYGVIDSFEPICTAPCAVQVPRGTYLLGLSQGEGRPRRADHSMLTVAQNTDLTLEYQSREGIRIGGWVMFGVSTLGYLAAALAPLVANVNADDYLTVLAVATVAYLVLMIPEFIMIFLNDHADVRPVNGVAAPSGQF